MFTTLSQAKKHLNLDCDFHSDDNYLINLIMVAEEAIAKRIDKDLNQCIQPDGYLPQTIRHAILLLIGTWYANRETFTPMATNEIPQGFNFLADLNKNYYIP